MHGLVGVESLFCQTAWLVLSRRLELSRPRAFGLSDEMEVSCRRSRLQPRSDYHKQGESERGSVPDREEEEVSVSTR